MDLPHGRSFSNAAPTAAPPLPAPLVPHPFPPSLRSRPHPPKMRTDSESATSPSRCTPLASASLSEATLTRHLLQDGDTASADHPPGPPPRRLTLAVVGDVHDQWGDDSEAALASLGADVVVFVGDFGNEDADLVSRIAALPHTKAVMLGNHDAWYSLTPRGKHRAVRVALMSSSLRQLPPPGQAVRAMLRALGDDHVGLAAKAMPELGLSFVGGRPFSKGGQRWDDVSGFYAEHYGIGSMEESMHRIVDVALSQPPDLALIVIGHNGPTGLGGMRHSPCGVDWQQPEEDFGDPDLEEALEVVAKQGRPAALVLFGHMDPSTGTVYLNSAVVPRVRKFPPGSVEAAEQSESGASGQRRGHHTLLVEMTGGAVTSARHVWVEAPSLEPQEGLAGPPKAIILAAEEVVKSTPAGDGSGRVVVSYFRANSAEWTPVVLEALQGVHVAGYS